MSGRVTAFVLVRPSLLEEGQTLDRLSPQCNQALPVPAVLQRRLPSGQMIDAYPTQRWQQPGRINPSPRPDRRVFRLRHPLAQSLVMSSDQIAEEPPQDDQSDDEFCD